MRLVTFVSYAVQDFAEDANLPTQSHIRATLYDKQSRYGLSIWQLLQRLLVAPNAPLIYDAESSA